MALLFIRMMSKQQLVAAVHSALPDDHPCKALSRDDLIAQWFVGMRSGRGLHLTQQGNSAFLDADIEYADRIIPYAQHTPGFHDVHFTSILKQKLQCPYYLHTGVTGTTPTIRLFDLSLVTWIDLHGGIVEYVKQIQTNIFNSNS